MRTSLQRDHGDDWEIAANDIERAIDEFGSWVEGRIERRVNDYVRSVRSRNARRAKSSPGSQMEQVSTGRVEDIHREEVSYLVQGWVMQVVNSMGEGTDSMTGLPVAGRKMVMKKRATYDPLVDFDWDTDDVIEEWA